VVTKVLLGVTQVSDHEGVAVWLLRCCEVLLRCCHVVTEVLLGVTEVLLGVTQVSDHECVVMWLLRCC